MPKLHYISKKFLKEQGCTQCLASSQKIQEGQEEDHDNSDAIHSTTTSNNHDKSKLKAEEVGEKRRYPSSAETPSEVNMTNTNQNCSNASNYFNYNRGHMDTTALMAPAAAAAAGVSNNLQRRNQHHIWVRIGATDHAAFELCNPDNPYNNDSSTVWVEYVSNGDKECVSRSQISHGLQDRKRKRPNFFHRCRL